MSTRFRFVCAATLLSLNACGGVSRLDRTGHGVDAAGASSSGSSEAGASAGSASAGSASAGSASAGSASAGSAGASSCTQFNDDAPLSVTVTILNNTTAPLYIGPRMQTCGASPLFEVHDLANSPLTEPSNCDSQCQSWIDGEPSGGCPAICALSQVTKLAVGEHTTQLWTGLRSFEAQLPRECNAAPFDNDALVSCSVDQRVASGSYTFYSFAGSDLACDSNLGGCGECAVASTGGCTVNGATVTGSALTARARVAVGAASLEGGSLPDDGYPPVELVFSDAPG